MKINLHWLSSFVDLKVGTEELLKRINTQLGEIESVIDLGQKYAGATIVKVAQVSPHPAGGGLSVCLIDDKLLSSNVKRRPDGLIQIVCGAPNVSAGMLAIWLPPSAAVPYTFDQPEAKRVRLAGREIRGVMSWGMLASAFELDLGADKETILPVEACPPDKRAGRGGVSAKNVGHSFAETFALDTQVIDIENKMFTHRPDCFGLAGVAREIAAITDSDYRNPLGELTSQSPAEAQDNPGLKLDVRCPELVVRLHAHLIRSLTVGTTSIYEQGLLSSVGLKSINNIVDATNMSMYLSGQPTHAFDYDKLLACSVNGKKAPSLIVRLSESGEKLALLSGKTLTFDQPAIVIATDKEPVALGGIMGGLKTEVDQNTTRVVIECANFNMYNLRRTTMHYGVFSEAATRFTKGPSPRVIPGAINMTSAMIARYGPADEKMPLTIEAYRFDADGANDESPTLETSADFINQRLGSDVSAARIAELLKKVGFEAELRNKQSLRIRPPFWRTDIAIAEDIVEEIGRLNGGYQSLTPVLPSHSPKPTATDSLLLLKAEISRALASRGASEAMSYSFVSNSFLEAAKQKPADSFQLANPLNKDLAAYRQSLTPSLLRMAASNRRAGHKDFALFEIGPVHLKTGRWQDDEGLPLDLQRAAFVCRRTAPEFGSPFYLARRYLELAVQRLGLELTYEKSQNQPTLETSLTAVYELERAAVIKADGKPLGMLGLLGGNADLAGWELDLDILLSICAQKRSLSSYQAVAKYPKSSQDLTLQVHLTTAFAQIQQVLESALASYKSDGWQAKLELLSIFQPKDKSSAKNVSFRLTAGHQQRTVRKEEISEILQAMIREAERQLKAEQVV